MRRGTSRYADVLDICDVAVSKGLSDGTKIGFEGRKKRILKKIEMPIS